MITINTKVNRIILCVIGWISIGNFAEAFTVKDSLSQYMEIAARNNPLVIQRYYEYEAALQKVAQVSALPDPEFNAGVFLKPMELTDGKQVADFKLMQMFPWFGVIKNGRDEMSLMAKAKYEQFLDVKLQINFDVLRTWNELYKIKQSIEISKKSIELLKTIERLSIVKFKSSTTGTAFLSKDNNSMQLANNQSSSTGMGNMSSGGSNSANTPGTSLQGNASQMGGNSMGSQSGVSGLSDLYRIKIEILELENSIELLNNTNKTVSARFNSYLNRPVSTVVLTPDTLALFSKVTHVDSNYDKVIENNPMLSMIKFEEQAYEAKEKMSRAMGYPMVGLGINYTIINKSEMSSSPMNGKNMVMPMVSLSIPIFRKKYDAMQKEAQLLSSAARQNYIAVSNTLQTEYLEAVQLYKDAARRLKINTEQRDLAKKSLEIIIRNFSSASSSLTDVLRVRQQLLEYEYKSVEALTDLSTSAALINRITATLY